MQDAIEGLKKQGSMEAIDAFASLRNYCEAQGFKGWDPYDGLNSKVFQAMPFAAKSAILRLMSITPRELHCSSRLMPTCAKF